MAIGKRSGDAGISCGAEKVNKQWPFIPLRQFHGLFNKVLLLSTQPQSSAFCFQSLQQKRYFIYERRKRSTFVSFERRSLRA
jgi:hypothetical protein